MHTMHDYNELIMTMPDGNAASAQRPQLRTAWRKQTRDVYRRNNFHDIYKTTVNVKISFINVVLCL